MRCCVVGAPLKTTAFVRVSRPPASCMHVHSLVWLVRPHGRCCCWIEHCVVIIRHVWITRLRRDGCLIARPQWQH